MKISTSKNEKVALNSENLGRKFILTHSTPVYSTNTFRGIVYLPRTVVRELLGEDTNEK